MRKAARSVGFVDTKSRFVGALLFLSLGWAVTGCEKKSPPDLAVEEGYRLLETDPKGAYEALSKAKQPNAPRVLLGRGLALERLRKYEDAEKLLAQAVAQARDPIATLPLARVRVVLGKADEARPLVDELAKKLPGDLSVLLLSTCLANDDARARTTLALLNEWGQLAESSKTSPPNAPSEYYLSKSVLHAQLKERQKAANAARQAKSKKLTSPESTFSLVELAVKSGRGDLAMELLRKLEEEDVLATHKARIAQLAHGLGDHALVGRILHVLPGNSPELLALRAEHKFFTQQPRADGALRRALDAAKEDGARARLWSMLAEALLRDGQAKEAKKEAEAMLEKYPSPGGRMLLARIELALDEPLRALAELKPLLEGPETPVTAYELAALAYVDLKQTERARKQLALLIEKDPGHLRAVKLAVDLEMKRGQHQEAIKIIEASLDRKPRSVGLLLLLAETKRRAKGDEAAIETLRSAVEKVPEDPRLWVTLAQAVQRKGSDAEALAVLETGQKAAAGAPMIILALAAQLEKAGERKRATSLYESLITEAQGDPVALNNLAMLYVDEGKNLDEAVALAERARKLSPAPGIVDTLGWALFKRGSPKDKARALELLSSVRDNLTSATSKFHLGAVKLASGETEEGNRLLQQALAQPGDFPESEQARELLATSR